MCGSCSPMRRNVWRMSTDKGETVQRREKLLWALVVVMAAALALTWKEAEVASESNRLLRQIVILHHRMNKGERRHCDLKVRIGLAYRAQLVKLLKGLDVLRRDPSVVAFLEAYDGQGIGGPSPKESEITGKGEDNGRLEQELQ